MISRDIALRCEINLTLPQSRHDLMFQSVPRYWQAPSVFQPLCAAIGAALSLLHQRPVTR